jgi:hypothetical protein
MMGDVPAHCNAKARPRRLFDSTAGIRRPEDPGAADQSEISDSRSIGSMIEQIDRQWTMMLKNIKRDDSNLA